MTSKLDYLKKYMSNDDEKKKKKKKKKSKVKDMGGFKIIDDGDLITFNEKVNKKKPEITNEPSDDDEREALALMTTQEELPQVAGIVDDSRLKTKFTTGGWKSAFERNDDTGGADINIKEEPLSDNEDGKILQRKRPDSPPSRKRHDSSPADSPPRRKRHDSDQADSPPRRKRHDSDQADSPPRRKRHDSDPESPPRRKRQDSSEDNSPPRRSRHDSDNSPPRKSIKTEVDSDISPPRNIKTEEDSDISPPRIKQEPEEEDLSPPRKGGMSKTLDGKKAGLQNAKMLKAELETHKRKENESFSKLSSEVSGRDAKTKVRGRLKDREEEERMKKEKADTVRKEVEAKYAKWNRGLKQLDNQKARIASDLQEMDKPMARSVDDEDRDAHLKAVEREEDPMLQYIRKKKTQKQASSGLPQYPKYKGPPPAPNRFGIMPGYRWDGVDRSTGFEKKLFQSQNKRKAFVQEAHMWSTEDM